MYWTVCSSQIFQKNPSILYFQWKHQQQQKHASEYPFNARCGASCEAQTAWAAFSSSLHVWYTAVRMSDLRIIISRLAVVDTWGCKDYNRHLSSCLQCWSDVAGRLILLCRQGYTYIISKLNARVPPRRRWRPSGHQKSDCQRAINASRRIIISYSGGHNLPLIPD